MLEGTLVPFLPLRYSANMTLITSGPPPLHVLALGREVIDPLLQPLVLANARPRRQMLAVVAAAFLWITRSGSSPCSQSQ